MQIILAMEFLSLCDNLGMMFLKSLGLHLHLQEFKLIANLNDLTRNLKHVATYANCHKNQI